ncbi:MAG: pyruvate dehydrogenase E2 component (dihydrolipoamide acetyltransferase) [Ilumatobacter sp.]|jgi:pyruvate dehydrogenase E2 component (dihydrolipoamide acetyltransferase)
MATEFLMPKLGLTMESGTIAEWLVPDGDDVTQGSAVLRIETDKTETDVEAPASGRLVPVGQVGDTFDCGQQIGWVLADGEEAPEIAAPAPAAPAPVAAPPAAATAAQPARAATTSTGRLIASPKARQIARDRGLDLRTIAGTGPGGRIISEDLTGVVATPAATQSASAGGISVPATAAARQLADLLGVNLASVPLDATEGRVTKESVALYVRHLISQVVASPAAATPTPATPAAPVVAPLPPALQPPTSVIPMRGMRGTIAKRMHESLTSMAQLTLQMDADLDAVVADRNKRKAAGIAPSYTDYVIAAAARALVLHPGVNSQITDDGVALLPDVHVGMAVALDGGLIVPVVSNTTGRDLTSLGAETTRLAEAARSGSLTLPELEGGTFSVSTLGMYGVDGFTPVINPPNTAILGVGRLRDDLVLSHDGTVGKTTRMTLSLTWDHRAFDGAPAAAFAKTIVELLGDPATLDTPQP